MHGRDEKLTVAGKRIAVTLLVAEAHKQTMADLLPTLFQKFVQFGYVHSKPASEMHMFTMPSTYKFSKVDAVVSQFNADVREAAAAADHAPSQAAQLQAAPQVQRSIASFFVAKPKEQ